MELIKAAEGDLDELLAMYRRAADQMKADGLRQWQWGVYPTEDMIREDVRKGLMYIQRLGGTLAGAVSIADAAESGEDYSAVHWTGGMNPGYFHRLVVNPSMQGAGLAGGILDDLQQILRRSGCDCIRCDTSPANKRALRLYEKMGFRPCGHITWSNTGQTNIALNKPLKRETPMWPIRMIPAFRSGSLTPWGGERLRELFGKDIPEAPTGESLEVSCIPGLESTDEMGRKLPELIRDFGEKLVGRYADKPFPLLLKLLDVRKPLSVQVHPGDEYAAQNEGGKQGKTEAWLILDAPEDGGDLVYGIRAGTTIDELRKACEQGSAVEPLLHRVKVRRGDVCYIPSGCIHSIGAGIVLYEIQQSSDLTYRFYDWDRTDANGNRRELHLKKALDVANLKTSRRPVHVERSWGVKRVLNEKYFTLDIIQTEGAVRLPQVRNFGIITGVEGELTMGWQSGSMTMKPGETFLLPASAPDITLKGIGIAALSMPAG